MERIKRLVITELKLQMGARLYMEMIRRGLNLKNLIKWGINKSYFESVCGGFVLILHHAFLTVCDSASDGCRMRVFGSGYAYARA